MEILTGTIPKIFEYTVEPIGRQVGYLINYKSNLESLRSQLKNLDAAKDRMKHRVDEVERNGKGVEIDAQNWRKEADGITQEAEKILGNEGQAKTKCFRGVCPNIVSYHQFSRKSAKLAKEIELHAKKEFPSVSYDPPLEEICATPSQNYMAFESRILMVNEIMKELKNPDTNMIGVYGLGGVGKTTLAQEVYRQAMKENLFDEVVIVLDVKKYPDLEKKERIQKKIVEKLGMDVDVTHDIEARAKHLWNRIKDKNIFVILDDVWEAIDLEALGLRPMVTCKILLTSRDRVSDMSMQKEFQLEVLGMEESWSLFEKMAGDVVQNDRIHEVAIEIAKKCGGLPVLVVAVARSLRSASTLEEWRVALRGFKSFDEQGLAKSAYLALEWSYNQLDGNELKRVFLLCGIIAGGSCIIFLSDLLKYAMGLSLVKNVDTVEEARDKLISLLKKLIKDYCLLLDINDDGDFRMHELVRDVAIGIAFKDKYVIAKAYGDELKEWPDRDSLKKCTAISLKSCKIPRLPEVPWVCPELRFIVLENHNIDDSLEIPGNYFEGMKELKVLDATRLRIPSLPPSLQSLTNLQTLCLDHCVLGDIALVGQLTNLKILSFVHSQVKELPKEIGQLTHLQLLDLTGCSELVLIPPGVISSLTSLEDLRMGSFKEWEGGLIDGRSNASVSELKQLRQLTALDIHIPDAKLLPANMFSDTRLERYTILIGDCWPRYPRIYGTSMLKLKLTSNSQFDQGIKLLLKRCEDLDLDGMKAANIISYILASDSGKQLKNLHVQNNDEVTSLINSSHAFPILESLSLYNLVNLETVCCGQLIAQPFQQLQSLTLWNLPKLSGFSSKGSRSVVSTEAEEIILENEIGGPAKLFMNEEVLMPNLTRLILHQCDGLKFLFSCSMARRLLQLEHIEISKCHMMEEIVSTSGYNQEHTNNMFCNLKYLKLQHLLSLTRFYSRSYIEFSLLETLHIEDCPRLGTFIFDRKSEITSMGKENDDRSSKENLETVIPHFLFDQKVGFPSLESLIIYDMPKLRTIWHCQLAPDSFQKLKNVGVLRCHNLINIFAPSMMGRLNVLHTLWIKQCKSLQVVFEVGVVFDVNEAYNTSMTQLKTFECPNLDLVVMDSCDSLKNIFPPSVAKGLQQLSELYVENCGILEEIVANDGLETTPEFVLSKVTLVQLQRLPQLRSFYPGLHVSKWPSLKSLRFFECFQVEILASEYSIFQERLDLGTPIEQPFFLVDKGNPFPNLESLYLCKNTEIWYEAYDPLGRRSNASLSELKQLHQLTALVIHFPDAKLLPANMFSDTRLERYTIVIGDCWLFPDIDETFSNMLKLKLTTNSQFDQGIKLLLKRCEDLDLDGMEAANIISHILASDSGKQLKNLHVQNNDEVTSLINSSHDHAFPILESLSLYNLVNLETVCCGQLIAQHFQKLRSLTLWNVPKLIGFSSKGSTSVESTEAEEIILENEIGGPTKPFMNGEVLMVNLTHLILHQCDGLRFLFSSSMAKSLEQLEHIEISKCQMMEEIVSTSGYNEEHTDSMFCNLKSLKLQRLPSLTRFYSGSYIEFSLLEKLHIEDCPRLGTFIVDGKSEITTMGKENEDRNSKENLETVIPHFLFDEKVGFPSLERLIIHDLPALMTIWHNQLAQDSFCRLKEVNVYRCHNLINIFARSMIGRLNALYTLQIWQCQSLQVVFELGGVFEAYDTSTTQLKTFECPNLDFVEMDACERLINIFSASVAKGLEQLTKLSVENCGLMEINGKEKGSGAMPLCFQK